MVYLISKFITAPHRVVLQFQFIIVELLLGDYWTRHFSTSADSFKTLHMRHLGKCLTQFQQPNSAKILRTHQLGTEKQVAVALV